MLITPIDGTLEHRMALSGPILERLRASLHWNWRNGREQQKTSCSVTFVRAGRASCNTREDHPMTDPTPPQIPALQITHTVDDVWRVAAKWSDSHLQIIDDFESETEANEWIATEFQDWLDRRTKG